MDKVIKKTSNIYVYILTTLFCLLLFCPITAHAAWQNGSSNLSWSKTSGYYDVGINSITYQYDFSSKGLIVYLNGFSLSGWSAPWGHYSPEEREYWYPSLRIEPVYGSSIKFQDATWYDEQYGMKSWGYVGCDIYYYPYRPGSKVSPWFRLANATNLTSITLQITGDSSYYGSSSSTTTTREYTAQITINLTPATNQLKHSHNSSGVEYAQANASVHYKYTYCNGHGSDRSQNRSSSTESHSFGSWSEWSDISVEQQRKQRSCSKCGYVDYAYQPRPYTITYAVNNGSLSYTQQGALSYESTVISYGSTLGTLPTATRTGYIFNGFFTAPSGGTQVSSGTTVTGAVTYYAQWTPIVYTIRYNTYGGTIIGTPNPTEYTNESQAIILNNPALSGRSFTGWSDWNNDTLKTTYTIPAGSIGDLVIFANYDTNSSYPVYTGESKIKSNRFTIKM